MTTTTAPRPTTQAPAREQRPAAPAEPVRPGGATPTTDAAGVQVLDARISKARAFNCCGRGECGPDAAEATADVQALDLRVSKGFRIQ